MIKHLEYDFEDGTRVEFTKYMINVGNGSDNSRDAYNNGKRDNMITYGRTWKRCEITI
jgi:hypothetical protein